MCSSDLELPFAQTEERKQTILAAGRKKAEEERSLVNIADVTTAVSEVDAQYYRSIARAPESIRLFSNVVDLDSYAPVGPPEGFSKPAIVLPGTFYSPESPMAEGTRWFINEILPRIRDAVPAVTLYLVGKGSDS